MHWYTDVIRKYAVFGGRAARPEYWWFALITGLIWLAIVAVVAGASGSFTTGRLTGDLYSLAVFLPSLGVGIRRLHDTNRSGWWYLIVLIPIIGWIWLIVLMATAGDAHPNRYGPDPYGRGGGFDPQTGEPLAQPSDPSNPSS